MKRLLLAAMLTLTATATFADTYVHGYYRQDGTYVQPHYRSDPNGTTSDNFSTRGNTNPYTGERGTKDPDSYQNQGQYANPFRGHRGRFNN